MERIECTHESADVNVFIKSVSSSMQMTFSMTTLKSGKCNNLWHLKHWNRLGIKACKKWSIVWAFLAADEEGEKMRKTNIWTQSWSLFFWIGNSWVSWWDEMSRSDDSNFSFNCYEKIATIKLALLPSSFWVSWTLQNLANVKRIEYFFIHFEFFSTSSRFNSTASKAEVRSEKWCSLAQRVHRALFSLASYLLE